jgi:hypothetical protein
MFVTLFLIAVFVGTELFVRHIFICKYLTSGEVLEQTYIGVPADNMPYDIDCQFKVQRTIQFSSNTPTLQIGNTNICQIFHFPQDIKLHKPGFAPGT